MPMATMTSKGQITIPREIREALRLRAGDRVDFRLTGEGGALLAPAHRTLASLAGIARPGRRGLTLEGIDRVVRGRRP